MFKFLAHVLFLQIDLPMGILTYTISLVSDHISGHPSG